jgi:hypothetical protein
MHKKHSAYRIAPNQDNQDNQADCEHNTDAHRHLVFFGGRYIMTLKDLGKSVAPTGTTESELSVFGGGTTTISIV